MPTRKRGVVFWLAITMIRVRLAAALLALALALPLAAQPADSVYQIAERMPTPLPDTRTALAYLQQSLASSPAALALDAEGTIIVQFVVGADGAVRDSVVARGLSPELDAEALRAVAGLRFEPGLVGGRAVAVRTIVPVHFDAALARRLREASDAGFELPDRAAQMLPSEADGMRAMQMQIRYPQDARDSGVRGVARVGFVIDPEGRVTNATLIRPLHPAIDSVAVRAVRSLSFRPAERDGRPIASYKTLSLTFEQEGERPRERFEITEVTPQMLPDLRRGLQQMQRRLRYPDAARRAEVEGRVIVQFVVDEEGRVEAPFVVESPSPLLNEAALEAIRTTRWRPGSTGGVPQRVQMTFPITFRLR